MHYTSASVVVAATVVMSIKQLLVLFINWDMFVMKLFYTWCCIC